MSIGKLLKGTITSKESLEDMSEDIREVIARNPFSSTAIPIMAQDMHNLSVLAGGIIACNIILDILSQGDMAASLESVSEEIKKEIETIEDELYAMKSNTFAVTIGEPKQLLQNYTDSITISSLVGTQSTLRSLLEYATSEKNGAPDNVIPFIKNKLDK